MAEISPEKTKLTYIFPSILRSSNPSSVHNASLTDYSTFDGLYPPEYAGVALIQNRNSCCDQCPHSAKNSAELLKRFKQQWYKTKDPYRKKDLPFHTNIGLRPPKIPRVTNPHEITSAGSSSSQEVSQIANVAPADPSMLEKILKDLTGYLNVQGKVREVRFYGEKSIVMMDWNDPRDVCFQSSSRSVIIDEKDILILSFNSAYSNYTFPDGETIRIRLGAPTRELYINGEPVEVKFGGPPVNVLVGDSYHKIQLGGPSPKVYVGNVKRKDIMAGRINLIIDENLNNIFHIYLDPKPQKFDINGTPFILRFVDSLQTVLINERPFKTEFGGSPIAVKLFGEIHLLRFSSLPVGIVPGLVHIVNMESRRTDLEIRNSFPLFLPWNDPSLTYLSTIANNSQYHFNYHYYKGKPANCNVSLAQNTHATLPKILGEMDIQQSTHLDANGINVLNLYHNLVEKGIIKHPVCEKQARNNGSRSISVDLSMPESLKHRNMRIVYELYSGAQCDICTLRFLRKSGEYASHIDWHYQIKIHTVEKKIKWWCHASEFPRSEQDVDHISWFEKQKPHDPFTVFEKLTLPAKDFGPKPTCSLCHEDFNQFYDEDADDWMLSNAVVHNLNLCHPTCCLKVTDHKLTSLQAEIGTKNIVPPENDRGKISKDIFICSAGVESETGSILEQYDTVIPYSIVNDNITTYAEVNESSSSKINNEPFTDDLEDSDIEDVVIIKPEIETVDLSEDNINHSEKITIEEMAVSSPCWKEIASEANDEHQNFLNVDNPNDISDPFSMDDNDSIDEEIEFNEIAELIPGTVQTTNRGAKMTVMTEVVAGEINSSLCSIM